MAGLVNIGFGNKINSSKLIAVVSPDAAPIKRLVQNAKDMQKVIDATQGRKTKAVLIMENDHVVLSALQPDTITKRFSLNGLTEAENKNESE